MINKTVTISNKLGLHARAATKFVNMASGYESDVYLICNGQRADGKSIMGIMMLAAPQGTTLELEVTGADEKNAASALIQLINERFGEEE